MLFPTVASAHPHYLTFTLQTYPTPPPRTQVQVISYTDDITITLTHTSMTAAKKYIQPYTHKVFFLDKTTCTLFTPDPAEYTSNLDLKIINTSLPMAIHPKILGPAVHPNLTYNTHIQNISVHTHKPLQIIKALTAT